MTPVVYWLRNLTCLQQGPWRSIPARAADSRKDLTAPFATLGRRQLPFTGGAEVRWAH